MRVKTWLEVKGRLQTTTVLCVWLVTVLCVDSFGLSVMRTPPSVTTPSTWGCPAARTTSVALPAFPPVWSSSAALRNPSGSPPSSPPPS